MTFQAFATRWDNPRALEEIPCSGLSFSLPLSDHGECGFTATIGPGRNHWRAALSAATSGILIASDGVPVWAGVMLPESQSGPRSFDVRAREWGHFFASCPAVPFALTNTNDHALQRRLISDAQAVPGQDVKVIAGSSLGAATSDLTVNTWDTTTVEEEFRRLGEASDGPEWYFAATGTMDNPTRTLVQGDRLGSVSPVAVLEYVEDSQEVPPPPPPPLLLGLGDLVPADGPPPVVAHRRGGNVIAHPARTQAAGITVAVATGSGDQAAQLRMTATATSLLTAGFPRRTAAAAYSDVVIPATLQRHADADLAAARGMVTGYSLTTYGSNPEWFSIARGDSVRVELDTDVYAGARPLIFTARVLDIRVDVPDEGDPVVTYVIADLPGV